MLKNIIVWFALLLFILSNFLYTFSYIQKSWEYQHYDSPKIESNKEVSNVTTIQTDNFKNFVVNMFSNENNWWNYIYDYWEDYYDAIRDVDYDLNKCVYKDWIKYCKAKIDNDLFFNVKFNKYNCYYNTQYKSNFCIFNFKKSKRYVWEKISSDEIKLELSKYEDLEKYWINFYYVPKYWYLENNWKKVTCIPWYIYNSSLDWCEKIDIPDNAHLDSTWKKRICDLWYVLDDEKNWCKKVKVPANWYLSKDWKSFECKYWYVKNIKAWTCDRVF